jgi:hypothetical protein
MTDKPHPKPDFSGSGPVEYNPIPATPASRLASLLAREEASLLAIEGVTSVGIGHGPPGGETLVVGVVDASVGARLPKTIEDLPLIVKVTGPVDALSKR